MSLGDRDPAAGGAVEIELACRRPYAQPGLAPLDCTVV